jgi:hypothetical protein
MDVNQATYVRPPREFGVDGNNELDQLWYFFTWY